MRSENLDLKGAVIKLEIKKFSSNQLKVLDRRIKALPHKWQTANTEVTTAVNSCIVGIKN